MKNQLRTSQQRLDMILIQASHADATLSYHAKRTHAQKGLKIPLTETRPGY